MKLIATLIISITLLVNCTKTAGTGGKATIKGSIDVTNIKNGVIKDQYKAQEHNVYLIYGEGDLYSDNMKTSFNGEFEFKFLNKGKYQVFIYSECNSCPKGQDSLIRVPIEINKTKETIEMETIKIINYI